MKIYDNCSMNIYSQTFDGSGRFEIFFDEDGERKSERYHLKDMDINWLDNESIDFVQVENKKFKMAKTFKPVRNKRDFEKKNW